MMLLAHIDVVEAKREDWSTDPFKLVEMDGYYQARGTADDKFMAAAFVANFIRYRQEGYKPERDIILVLETDEETLDKDHMGITWLLKNKRDLIDAEFALNEGAGVGLDKGKPLRNGIQTSEKIFVNFSLEVKDKGGHSSQPGPDNAIYRLAEGLVRLGKYAFPVNLNETTRAFLQRASAFEERKDRRRHEVGRLRESRSRGGCAALGDPPIQQPDPHHLRRDDAGRRPRDERTAAARQGARQLPRAAERIAWKTSRRTWCAPSPTTGSRSSRREGEGEPALAAPARPRRRDREARRRILARRADHPGHVRRRHDRHAPAQRRHADVRPLGHGE